MRKTKFSTQGGSALGRQNEYYYHIYNRGVDKREVFCDGKDYFNFMIRMRDLNNDSKFEERVFAKNEAKKELSSKALELSSFLADLPNLVEFITYCLNPNHYHFLIKQKQEDGIVKFMHKFGTGYTNYFNKRYNRSGSLFQGPYKSVPIKTDAQLLYVSAYINGNSEIHKIAKCDKWKYSSCLDFLGKRSGNLCSKKVILDQFKNIKEYQNYIKSVVKNSRDIKKEIKNCLIE